jgi:transposase
MANRLKMANVEAILQLHRQSWSNRRIARELGVHRDTVARIIRTARAATTDQAVAAKPATLPEAPLGENRPPQAGALTVQNRPPDPGALTAQNRPGALTGSAATPASLCEPFHDHILAKLDQGLTAQRIYQDLVTEQGFAGKYHSVRRYVRRLGRTTPLPFRRMECAAGEEAQVDFGSGAWVVLPDGKRRRPHVFRIVLSHSRKAYSEVVYRQTTENFVRCLENAFWHFGGVPRRVVLDNLRAAVTQADWFDPDLNPKVRSFAEHYGTVFLPTRPYTPRHKGKIERGIGYVKDNGLKGRTFASLDAQNRWLLDWEQTVADTRIHGTTRRQVGQQFLDVEKPALRPLPVGRFPFFDEGQRIVHRDGHVEVARAYYSVPTEYLGRTVWVRWDARLVRVFNERWEQIALHVKHEAGRFSTKHEHIRAEKISGIERGADWVLGRIHRIGTQAGRWAEGVLEIRDIEGIRVLHGLVGLTKKHSARAIDSACGIALSYGSYRLRTVRTLIGRQPPRQEQFEFMDQHPLIRPLSAYQQLVSALTKEVSS